jgi:IS5 family transposase
MRAHVGVDRKTKLIHAVVATPANVADGTVIGQLLHGGEKRVWGDAAYVGRGDAIREKAPEAKDYTQRRGRGYRYLTDYQRRINRARSRVRARVEHVIGVIKRVFGSPRCATGGLRRTRTGCS